MSGKHPGRTAPEAMPSPTELAGLSREEKLALLRRLARGQGGVRPEEGSGDSSPEDPPRRHPVSFAQRRLWFLDRLEPGGSHNTIFRAFRLRGSLDPAALAEAVSRIGVRHEPLRTRFEEVDGEPVQVVEPPASGSPILHRVDLSHLPTAERERRLGILARAEAKRPFDLERAPLARCTLVDLGEQDSALLLAVHHIVSDGWSLGILLRELSALYRGATGGGEARLPELTTSYGQAARRQRERLRGERLQREIEAWRELLDGAPDVLELPTDRPRPALESFRGAIEPFSLDPQVTADLAALGRTERATPFMVLFALFAAVLGRWSGRTELLVGTPVAGRLDVETEPLIGFFANTVVLRADLSGGPSFRELVRRVRGFSVRALGRQDVPFERLVEELVPERDLSRNPLFQVMFALQTQPPLRFDLGEVEVAPLGVERGLSKVDLTLDLVERDGALRGYLEYNTDLFDRTTVQRLARAVQRLARAAAAEPDRAMTELQILSAAEAHALAVEWQDRACRPRALPVHEVFARRAAEAPDAVAVEEGPVRWTYGALERASAALAERLATDPGAGEIRPDGPERRIAVLAGRSIEALIAFLGVLRAGAAYVPLDPEYPDERLAFMVDDAGVDSILAAPSHAERARRLAEVAGREVITLERSLPAARSDDPAPTAPTPPERAAYVLYTSGTTGRPKGVVIPHRALANHAAAVAEAYALGPEDRVLQFASVSFDIAGEEIYPTLGRGAPLVLRPPELSLETRALVGFLERHRISVANIPTPLWHEWCRDLSGPTEAEESHRGSGTGVLPPEELRLVIVGTEAALADRLERWQAALQAAGKGRPEWINAYGPTEATITSVLYRAAVDTPAGAPGKVPIGRPLAGLAGHILDARMEAVPIGAPGELFLGGAGVARGYLGRPKATAERFVPDPFDPAGGTRLYRTGDLARLRSDGAIEFLGRTDDQVKIRGFRVEPAEVESALAAHPEVREVAVVTREAAPGDRRLVAYVAGAEGSTPSPQALAGFLGERLPAYMVPGAFVIVGELPMTPSGKVDRRALPEPVWAGGAGATGHVPVLGPVEELLAGIWEEILEVDGPGAEDDFFRLGGHSLVATRLVARIRDRLGVELPLRTVFEAPTLRALARAVGAARAGEDRFVRPVPPIERVPRDEPIPASFAQQRLWFLDRLEPGSPQYNMPARLALEVQGSASGGRPDASVLERALAEIVRRHESLRTVLAPGRSRSDGVPVQVIRADGPVRATDEPLLPVVDLSALPVGAAGREADRVARAEGRRPFDLERGPLVRFRLLRPAGEGHTELLFTAHHTVSDGWSTDLFLGELSVLYAAFAAGEPSPLSEPPVYYADYAVWQREWLAGETLELQIERWRQALEGMPGLLELPSDRPRPPAPSGRGGRVRFRLPDDAAAAVERLTGEGATPFMVLLAAFAAVLHRASGQADFGVGVPVAGRSRTEIERVIGFFANTLVLRSRLDGDPSFRELIGRVRETALDAYADQDLPFEKLVEELQPERNLSHHPLFQVLFAYQDTAGRVAHAGPSEDEGLRLRMLPGDNDTARFDLALNLWPVSDRSGATGVAGYLEYACDLFDPTTAGRMVARLGELLADAGRRPTARVSELTLLSPAERQAVVREWNDTRTPFPEGACLHELVSAQVERTPDAVALVDGDRALSFAAFDRRVEALARHLRRLGVGPGSVVGVCAERSVELVIGLHGVVRAGGAYLPLDPDHPAERLGFMLEDAAVPVLLGQGRLLTEEADGLGETLRRSGARVVPLEGDLERDRVQTGQEPAAAAPGAPAADPEDAAYVIYTSGSTGRPKGVMVPHRGIVNRLVWMQRAYPLDGDDRVVQKTPFSFDVSVWELFWPLMVGARLEMAAPGRHGEPSYLSALLAERRITTLHFVPSMLQVFLEDDGVAACDGVLRVIASGEALPHTLAERFFERLPRAELHNLYGPTEASVDVSYHACRPGEGGVPIGRPIENIRLHVLDPAGRPAAIGVPGELHLGGVGLARCYLGRPALTAERFVPDPLGCGAPGERLYRTGDLCRWLADGEVDFLGRIDFQVKVRGLRIELGEIEAALADHEAVREVVVVARDDDGAGTRLVAYLVPHDGADAAPSVAALRAWVGRSLPDYMIPAAFVALDALPLSPNGKVDRRALPDPGSGRPELGREYVAPRTKVEEDLAAIWREVLRVDRVGVEDNFFELGGHSLLATQVMTRIEERFDVELPLRSMFESPTVAGLGERIVESGLSEIDDEELSRLLAETDELSEEELAALLVEQDG